MDTILLYKYLKRIFVISALFLFLANTPCWAVNMPFLSQSKVRLSIAPGKTKYGEIIVENPYPQPRFIRLYLEDWYYLPAGDGTKAFVAANTTPLSCASWITFSPAEITVPAYGRQRIGYSMKVPQEAKGSHYAVLFFETSLGEAEPTQEGVGAGINVSFRIATLFYIETEGMVDRTGKIDNLVLKTDKDKILLIQADFHNTGNVDITAGGSYHIMDKDGLIYARGEFNDIYTFPNDGAKFTATWKEPIPKGDYALVLTINIGRVLEEAEMGRGPIITKEAEIELGANGEVVRVGELK